MREWQRRKNSIQIRKEKKNKIDSKKKEIKITKSHAIVNISLSLKIVKRNF